MKNKEAKTFLSKKALKYYNLRKLLCLSGTPEAKFITSQLLEGREENGNIYLEIKEEQTISPSLSILVVVS